MTQQPAREHGDPYLDLGVLPSRLDEGIAARAAIGLIVLASDQTMEHEFRRIVRQDGVALYESRIFNDNAITPETLRAMAASFPAIRSAVMRAEPWAGLRPMTPEGTPLFGRKSYTNLYFNCGQGHMGWTMAHGSARITADLIAGTEAAIPLDGMTLN